MQNENLNLNHGIERGAKLTLEFLLDLHHVHLTARNNHTNQSVVISTGALSITNTDNFILTTMFCSS